MLNRRMFLGGLCSLSTRKLGNASPQIATVGLLQEFKEQAFFAISRDMSKMALVREGRSKRLINNASNRKAIVLAIVEWGSWRELYVHPIPGSPTAVVFSPTSDQVYVEYLHDGRHSREVIDLTAQRVRSRTNDSLTTFRTIGYLDSESVVGAEWHSSDVSKSRIVRLSLPTWEVTQEVSLGPLRSSQSRHNIDLGLRFSRDGALFCYSWQGVIVCRRTKDFSILWSRRPDFNLDIWQLAIAADGSSVAMARAEGTLIDRMRRHDIEVINAHDGTVVSKLPLNGISGIGISNAGAMLAVAEKTRLKSAADIEMNVRVFDARSGRQLGRFEHDRVDTRRDSEIAADFSHIQFAGDNDFLISAGKNTRISQFGQG